MTAFFFGDRERPLYGVYAPALGQKLPAQGAVLCYPLATEYLDAHRSFRQIAIALARAGVHVLRFDYTGTGDSWGTGEDGDLSVWLEDLDAAVTELRDMAGIDRISLVGFRLGATLAALFARERQDVHQLVLWEPVVDGARYAEEVLSASGSAACFSLRPGGACPVLSANGFALSEPLARELRTLEPARLEDARAAGVHVLTSDESRGAGLVDALGRGGVPVRAVALDAGSWTAGGGFSSAVLDAAVIRSVVECLTEGGALNEARRV